MSDVNNHETKKIAVFVYGTLKKGQIRHSAISSCKFLGNFSTEKKHALYNLGSFPALVESQQGYSVPGEVYEVSSDDVLSLLDRIEGHPNFYRRVDLELKEFSEKYPEYKLQTYVLSEAKVLYFKANKIEKW